MLKDPGAHFDEFAGTSIDIVDTLVGMHAAAEGLHLTLEETHAARWVDTTLSVDGTSDRFSMIGDEEHWLAYREDEATWLFVHARGTSPPEIDLVQVNPREYVSG
jgi:hypothetical protein